jgi:hypothetical protein
VSCSQPLELGDEFGSFKLVEWTTKEGTHLALEQDGDGTSDLCEVPLAPPKPHCTDDLEGLTLVYIGDLLNEGCTVSNSQGGYGSCSGVDDPGDPVDVDVESGLIATPDTGIEFGDLVVITDDGGGELPAVTNLSVTGAGGTQDLQIKTSCYKPLSLGDRFGSFVVYGMDREDDGPISLGGKVLYQYKVTNPNASTVDNVIVTDSVLGEIVSGESIGAGQTETYTRLATVYGTVTNIGTVTGDVGGSECEAAMDDATVEVDIPPQGSFTCGCWERFDEITMTWDGTQTVDVKAWSGSGSVSGVLLAEFDDVAPGDNITVDGFVHSQTTWEIFDSTGTTLLGKSEFNLTCQDHELNGIEDCGKNQGNGKYNDPTKINTWLFEGVVDDDETLVCTPELPPGVPPACGLGPELMLVLPGLFWWHRRRLHRAA